MDAEQARARFAGARVARLASVGADGAPHLVPITFALLGAGAIVTAVDHKPKRTTKLRRLANIAVHPGVALLADHYAEDWAELWWARADGLARVVEPGAEPALRQAALRVLVERYAPYRGRPPNGALIVVEVTRWSGWSARGGDAGGEPGDAGGEPGDAGGEPGDAGGEPGDSAVA